MPALFLFLQAGRPRGVVTHITTSAVRLRLQFPRSAAPDGPHVSSRRTSVAGDAERCRLSQGRAAVRPSAGGRTARDDAPRLAGILPARYGDPESGWRTVGVALRYLQGRGAAHAGQ